VAAKTVRFSTRELSLRTFPDFEQFFTQVHGCACTLYFFGRHLAPVAATAKERADLLGAPDRSRKHFPHKTLMRERELAAVRELLQQGNAHGILVYADREPVGWCHFGRAEELPVTRDDTTPGSMLARDPSSQWRITCFTTRMDYRRQGVADRALKAAVKAIRNRGGGWIEATPMAFPHDDPMVRRLRRAHGWGSPELTEYVKQNWPSKEIPGIGFVSACLSTSRTMGHMGTMSMFERLGFEATDIDEERSSDDPRYPPSHFVVMRLKV
jgi:ribosomal protein S18 acetylase RimI-like enzyme